MTSTEHNDQRNLRQMFLGLQEQMKARLRTNTANISHPGTSGAASEINWREMLTEYLPRRYQVSDGFVLDSKGMVSQQIDLIIFDRQYSPFLFHQDGATFVPAESLYAVFEVKQELNKEHIRYAGEKARSVRALARTSAPIPYAEGTYKPKPLHEIIAGILTARNSWSTPFGEPFRQAIAELHPDSQLDIGCSLEHGSFSMVYDKGKLASVDTSEQDSALIFFFLKLLAALQSIGTTPAMDFSEYGKNL